MKQMLISIQRFFWPRGCGFTRMCMDCWGTFCIDHRAEEPQEVCKGCAAKRKLKAITYDLHYKCKCKDCYDFFISPVEGSMLCDDCQELRDRCDQARAKVGVDIHQIYYKNKCWSCTRQFEAKTMLEDMCPDCQRTSR